ncbi:apiosidase-like domain-containing protein [Adhaeribacter radiodurans]|uniref:DUF4038 domain-containing protein n=1 Tax=Adhaeribacter radiodurans TaxID=2745197 RepID=A0A7L7LCU1_9BACT|nr:DUF4038 domain-containing protein [Adhaeribacter radiodurans]QMU30567.1 DUF4038 domain-containing protein [Adhaeribacter radiodurans]
MKFLKYLLFALIFTVFQAGAVAPAVHVWEMQELTFTAKNSYKNAYTDVTVWVDVTGPDFQKRVYGFWDGGNTFHLRLVATKPGTWRWKSGSNQKDAGLIGKTGSFTAINWSEKEKNENPLRRGFLRPSANQHALNHADGTPYFAIGDTWYPLGANRFKWYDDDKERPIGPEAGFKDYVRLRKAQGYNWVNVIAAFPNWKTDDKSWHIIMNDSAKTTVRSAWLEFGTGSAKNMDNEGGRPFFFPGKVPGYENYFPDMDRINPEYFKYLDRKIAYLNANGFVPFIEVSRRDAGLLWYKYYGWPDSYSRFIQYIFSRYQAYNTVLSPIHLDIIDETVSPDDYVAAIQAMEKKYGPPPFGNLLSANANPSTLENWGEDSWVTLHQIGNMREHNNYWYLTEIFNLKNPRPALNGEPYYSGYKDNRGPGSANYTRGADGGTERDNAFVRSGMYGSFLSGGLAGHVYGAEGIWGGDIEPAAPIHMWDAFQWRSGAEMQYLKTFAFSIGKRYQDLVPLADLVSPNKNHDILSYEGWAYCARTPDKNLFLAYFEKGCPQAEIRGARLNSIYRAQWFNPRNGTWQDVGNGKLAASKIGIIKLPKLPEDVDWGLKLVYEGPQAKKAFK